MYIDTFFGRKLRGLELVRKLVPDNLSKPCGIRLGLYPLSGWNRWLLILCDGGRNGEVVGVIIPTGVHSIVDCAGCHTLSAEY